MVARAATTAYEFDNVPDADFDIYYNDGSVYSDSSQLHLEADPGFTFPAVYYTPQLPESYEIEISFNYTSTGLFGSGIGFAESLPTNGVAFDNRKHLMYFAWQDAGSFRVNKMLCSGCTSVTNLHSNTPNANVHVLKLTFDGSVYKLFLDTVEIDSFTTDRRIKYIYFGNPELTSTSSTWSSIRLDYFRINYEDSFPYYMQNDSLWASEEYDNASAWAPFGKRGIERWGCALSTASMVLKHYEVNMPDGAEPNPSNLNTWLSSQEDGYIRGGLINWLAVSRMSSDSKSAGKSPVNLEFTSSSYSSSSDYDTPSIFVLPGHYVVGYDSDSTSYLIRDPDDTSNTSISKSSPDISGVYTYVPSNTDLSYFMFTTSHETTLELYDSEGNLITSSFTVEPIEDDVEGGLYSGDAVSLLLYPKPETGSYKVRVVNSSDSDRSYDLDAYLYDIEASVDTSSYSQTLIPSSYDEYVFSYSKDEGSGEEQALTISGIRALLRSYYDQGLIRSYKYYSQLDKYLSYAESSSGKRRTRLLNSFVKKAKKRTNKISVSSSQELRSRVESLL